jgi:hypothetical protein
MPSVNSNLEHLIGTVDNDLPAIRGILENMLLQTAAPGIEGGTIFPSDPEANDVFFRTDLQLLCFWDGTNWITVNKYALQPTVVFNVPSNNLYTVGVFTPPAARTFRAIYVKYIYFVDPVNNATNYWSFGLTPNGSFYNHTYNTSMFNPVNSWALLGAPIDIILSTTPLLLRLYEKTGTPGSIYLGATIYGHEVVA